MKREKNFQLLRRVLFIAALMGMMITAELFLGGKQIRVESDSHPLVPVASLLQATSELQQVTGELQQALEILGVCFGEAVDLAKIRSEPITITAYSSTEDQCNEEPHITASNKPVRIGIIAVSFDIMEELGLTFGQRVLIPGHGLFQIQDRMNRRWHRRVDIWHNDREAARLFGKQQGTMLWIDGSETPNPQLLANNDIER